MPDVWKEVLSYRLMKNARLGIPIRVRLKPRDYESLSSLRQVTGRSYADILRVILRPIVRVPGSCPTPVPKHRNTLVINARIPRSWMRVFIDKAWEEKTSNERLIGHAVAAFLHKHPRQEIVKLLKKQLDRVARLVRKTT